MFDFTLILFFCVVLMIWGAWLWRYQIRPHMERRVLNAVLQNHPNWQAIRLTETFLQNLYHGVSGKAISQRERKRLGLVKNRQFVYGEIQFLAFFKILDKVRPQSHEKFYDLGCGAGKAVFSVACFFDLSQSIGVELLPGLCHLANLQLSKAKQWEELAIPSGNPVLLERIAQIQFVNENFLHYDFSDGDIIFVNATALSDEVWNALCARFLQLKSGSRVITTSKKIAHQAFTLLHQGPELMSWGLNSVYIYLKLSE